MNLLTDVFRNGSDQSLFDGLTELAREDKRINNTPLSKWIIDPEDADAQELGIGTGVIEFANVDTVSTRLSLDTGDYGSVTLQFQDPFNLMLITPIDIDTALNQELLFNASSFKGAPEELQNLIEDIERTRQALEEDTAEVSRGRGISLSFFNVSFTSSNIGSTLSAITRDKVPSSFSTETSSVTEADFKITRGLADGQEVEISTNQPVDGERLFQEEKRNFDRLVSLLKEYTKKAKDLRKDLSDNIDSFPDVKKDIIKNFAGHNLINPMDYIYVYMSGNRITDDAGAATNPTTSDASLRSTFKNLVQTGTLADSITESLFIKLNKEELVRTRNGAFVFVGLANQSSRAYSESGTHTLSVTGSNTMKWLGFSKIDTQPSAAQPQGALNFPLTPFEQHRDRNSDEIKLRLLPANRENLTDAEIREIDEALEKDPNTVKTVGNFEGLVFKWKKGIFSTTAKIGFQPSNDGNKNIISANDAQFLYGFQINQQAFANLDAANIVSVLITGTPYNFNTFLKNSIRSGIHRPGPDTGTTYASNVRSVSRAFNEVNGQFEPLISINVSPSELNDPRINSSLTDADKALEETNNEIKRLTALRSESEGLLKNLPDDSENRSLIAGSKQSLSEKISELEIRQQELSAFKTLRQTERKFAYQDTLAEARNIGLLKGEDSNDTFEASLKNLQAILFNNQIKNINGVLFNTDRNYLIISNEYEEDLDIQAYAQFLKSEVADLWKSNYESPLEICSQVAQNLDFEFFCDTQGNIHFRPPQYNRTPLSVLRRIERENPNFKIFPPQIIALQATKEKAIQDKIDRLKAKRVDIVKDEEKEENIAEVKKFQEVKESIEKERKSVENLTVGQLLSLSGTVFFERFVEVDELVGLDAKFSEIDQSNVDAINQKFDALGKNSHKRFVIKDKDIISYIFDETSPPYTRVDVSGQTNLQNINDANPTYIWAGAVDYDLWRQFGYIPQEITKPFLRSGEFQCKPYAEFLIARAQKQIIRGSVTVAGNEYYQLGDVVFFEPYGTLFYVTGVSHSFTFNDRYTTELQLNYGRAPGGFIPTPLDVIGKNLIRLDTSVNSIASQQRDGGRVRATRTSVTFSDRRERVIGVIGIQTTGTSKLINTSDNLERLKRALAISLGHVGQVSFSEVTKQPTIGIIEIRHFGNSTNADLVKNWLVDPVDFTRSNTKLKVKDLKDQADKIKVVQFDSNIHRKSSDLLSFFIDNQPSESDLNNLVEIRIVSEGATQDEINAINKRLNDAFGTGSNTPS